MPKSNLLSMNLGQCFFPSKKDLQLGCIILEENTEPYQLGMMKWVH